LSACHAAAPWRVARPEVAGANTLRVHEEMAFPLYDGHLQFATPNLQRIGTVEIPRHDLFRDLGYERQPPENMPAAMWDSASGRAELFRAAAPGHAAVLVTLTLAHLHMQCVSCRTLHYFAEIKP
jgi:hypothetical protein